MKIAVVGAGTMGKNHARVIAASPSALLAGIFDVEQAAAGAVAASHGVRAYRHFDELLHDASVDGMIIATPTHTHHEMAIRALEAGKHVLVEKPMAATVKQAEAMTQAAHKAGLVLAVGHIERHNPVVRFAHDALAGGELGELIHIAARRLSNFPGRIRDVGAILDIGIHDIDVLRYLVGSEVTRVYANTGTFTKGLAFEDNATILLTFASGITGSIEVNWLTPMKVRRLSLTASRSYVDLDYIDQQAIIASSSFGEVNEANMFQPPLELRERIVRLKKEEPLALEIHDFAEASLGRLSAPLVTAEDGVAALRIAEAAVLAGRDGRAVTLTGT